MGVLRGHLDSGQVLRFRVVLFLGLGFGVDCGSGFRA